MTIAPPQISPPVAAARSARWRVGLLLAALALGLAALIFFFNPATHQFYPPCQFHRVTGLNCPGCGMTRAIYALLHGHFTAALRDNALLLFLLAILLGRSAWVGVQKRRGRWNGQIIPAKYLWLLLLVALVFSVLRNLPIGNFLSP